MGQVSWRASDELIDVAKRGAAGAGLSLNAYLSRLVEVAARDDPEDAEGERLRRRFRAAGILAEPLGETVPRPPAVDVRAARRDAGRAEATHPGGLHDPEEPT